MPADPSVRVLIPVKAFELAKARLAELLDPPERQRLAREMAKLVIRAARPLPTSIVCDDEAVMNWARKLGVHVEWTPGLGLNGALQEAAHRAAHRGVERVVIAHSDLPFAPPLAPFARGARDEMVVVPDRHLRGTNLLAVPTGVDFTFRFGVNSFELHKREAERLSLETRVVISEELGWDVDEPADLLAPTTLSTRSQLFGDGLLAGSCITNLSSATADPSVES